MFFDYSKLVTSNKTCKVRFFLLGMNGFRAKTMNERFTAAGYVDYVTKLQQKACPTSVFLHSSGQIIHFWRCCCRCRPHFFRELKQPQGRWQQERHKFVYLTMINNSFARFARALFIFGHFARTFSFFLRREKTGFAVKQRKHAMTNLSAYP